MPRFFAVHTFPDWTEDTARGHLDGDSSALPAGVEWKLTYCAFDDHKFYCEWEAPDKATLEGLFKDKNTPFDAIYAVKLLDPKTKTLE